MPITDLHGRKIHKLRVSLLDACNMKCFYCMPHESTFNRSNSICSKKINRLVTSLIQCGIDEVRITGGEPLIHPDLDFIIEEIGKLKLKKFGLTTNAVGLQKHIDHLIKNKCHYINISLDAITPETYHKITGTNKLNEVIANIFDAKEKGAYIKLNTVMLKGINDHEIVPLIEFAAKQNIEIRFLELMKIGAVLNDHEKFFISAGEIINRLSKNFTLDPMIMPIDSTSFNFKIEENSANIGFIASETQHFCKNCSRLRLDSHGTLRPCLMLNNGINISELNNEEDIKNTIYKILNNKPLYRIEKLIQPMHQIGG